MIGYFLAGFTTLLALVFVFLWRKGTAQLKRERQQSAAAATELQSRLSQSQDALLRTQTEARQQQEMLRQDHDRQLLSIQESAAQTRLVLERERDRLQQERNERQLECRSLQDQREQLSRDLERQGAEQRSLEQRMAEKQRELIETQDQLRRDFENLANKIFEDKNKVFKEQSRQDMQELIQPLRERIGEFQQSIHKAQIHQTEQSSQLKEQIVQLSLLNKDMLQDARNLTNALKGDSKIQGNWGEMILETVLDKSGLVKGREYEVQASGYNEEGRRLQPDVVLHLPGNKVIILDSKVSLTAYERHGRESDPTLQAQHARAHLDSMRQHIQGLSKKDYPSLYGVRSQDFVLMFIPIEGAFSLALSEDDSLYMDAFSRGVVMVSTSTLLATLRTIKHIWNQEMQSRNVLLIAEEAGKLHDQFVMMVEQLRKLGTQLDRAQISYQDTVKRLSTGSGNLIRRVDMLRKLGAKARKEIPEDLRQEALSAAEFAQEEEEQREWEQGEGQLEENQADLAEENGEEAVEDSGWNSDDQGEEPGSSLFSGPV